MRDVSIAAFKGKISDYPMTKEQRFILKGAAVVLVLLGLLLAGCDGVDTPAPTDTTEPAPAEVNHATESPVAEATAAAEPTSPTETPATTEQAGDLEAIDTVLEEIDNQVCLKALETRAEIEELMQDGQDLADLLGAMDELIAELEGCSLTPVPE
jgi:hypothetical protein